MPVVDFHNHYYPPRYLESLQSGRSSVTVTVDADGNPIIHYPGDYNIAVRGHRDLAYRADVLRQHGVDTQVLTLTTPGTHVETEADAARLASLVNDEFLEGIERYRGALHGARDAAAQRSGRFGARTRARVPAARAARRDALQQRERRRAERSPLLAAVRSWPTISAPSSTSTRPIRWASKRCRTTG